jgi:hypothetical protein
MAAASGRRGVAAMKNKHIGSSIEDFLKKEGIFKEAQAQAVREVVAWRLVSAAKKQKLSKAPLAALLARLWGAWEREETPAATVARIRKIVEADFHRHHRRKRRNPPKPTGRPPTAP